MSATTPDTRVGTTLDERWRLERVIGEGGFGTVFEATDLKGGHQVALKVLHPHLSRDFECVTRFEREALAVAAVGHPNIVDIYESGALSDGARYIALELLKGEDLRQRLKRTGPMRLADVAMLGAQTARALDAAHAKGVVHRDMKPENIFLTHPGDHVKVLDFGVSKFRRGAGDVASLTGTGATLGTPYFMAPEQTRGAKDVDDKADVYALGVILFRALTGQHPFEDQSLPMLALKICTEDPPPVTRYREDVPPSLEALIDQMLLKDPGGRPELTAVAQQLDAHVASDVQPVLTDALPTKSISPTALGSGVTPEEAANTIRAVTNPNGELVEEEPPGPPPGAGSAKFAKALIVIVALVGFVGIALYAMNGLGGDKHIERVVLPEPKPPLVDRMAPADNGSGWTFLNPLPRAMPTFRAVAVGGPGLVGMVGERGNAALVLQGQLRRWRTNTRKTLHAAGWLGPTTLLIAGEQGTLGLLTGEGGRYFESPTDKTLRAMVVTSPTDALVAGDEGTLLRVRGDQITSLDSGTDATLLAAAEHDGAVFFVGTGGVVIRVKGDSVTREPVPIDTTLRGVGGCAETSLYAAGDGGVVLRRFGEGRWRQLRTTNETRLTGVACDADRVAVVGKDGTVLLASGGKVVELPTTLDEDLLAVHSAPGEATHAVGESGRMLTIDQDRVRLKTIGSTANLFDLASLSGSLIAVGSWGKIIRQTPSSFETAESPTDSSLGAVVSYEPHRLIAVGDDGVVVDIRYDGSTILSEPGSSNYRDIVAGEGAILAVGTSGGVLRGSPEVLQPSTLSGVGTLWALSGSPSKAVAVGDDGIVLRFEGDTEPTRSKCGDNVLRGVVSTEAGEWAVGDGGTILRLDQGCSVEHSGGGKLFDVELGPNGRPMAAGEDGRVLERSEAGEWVEVDVGARVDLQRIVRTERSVYLVGYGGAILRHARLR